MRTRSAVAVVGCAVATALLFGACRDASVPVDPVAASPANLLGLTGVSPITRTIPLASDVSWSFTVASDGGASSNSTVGLSIVVPPGAVSSPTTITVTALQGSPVAYRFEPHGLQFDRKVTLTQTLQGTSAASELLQALSGAYFPSDEPILQEGLVLVSEILSGVLHPVAKTFSFQIEHFSGYLVASGNKPKQGGE